MSDSSRTIIVTGAAGFVGRRLMQSLLTDSDYATDRLLACDLCLADDAFPARVRCVSGDFGDAAVLSDILRDGADVVFHLAGVLGGAAEGDASKARRVNIDATLSLMEALRAQPQPARLVFASSIAVFGPTEEARIDDDTPPDPVMLYGAQKRMIEIAIEQATARGWIDGIAVRLPGIVARPAASVGLKSGFLSDQFHAWLAQENIVLPVSPQGTTWLLSASACVAALVHAAKIPPRRLDRRRALTLPALHVTFAEIVATMGAVGPQSRSAVTFQPDPDIDVQFGRQPVLETPLGDALGFRHDGDVETLVRRVFETLKP